VGVWIDGKPLYAKSFTLSSQLTVSASSWTNTDLSLSDVEKFVNGYAISDDGTFQGSVVVDKSNDVIQLQSTRSSTSYVKYLTVFYTKTTDSAGSGGYQAYGFSPIIYSTEEREVGVWTDNKPLYQKTYANVNLSNNQDVVIDANVSTMQLKSYVIDFSGTTNTSTQQTGANDTLYIDSRGLIYWINRPSGWWSALDNANITVWYTKTTDTAGSGEYNTLGIPNVHYDGNEKVIGTYFGETLYERTLNFTQDNRMYYIPNTTYVKKLVKHNGECTKDNFSCQIPYYDGADYISVGNDGNGIRIYTSNYFVGAVYELTIQYTKTT
jgi:hypothetical protein